MSSISIEQLDVQHPLFKGVFALREKVLRQPLGLSLHDEDLSEESNDQVFAALSDERVVGCVMTRPVGNDKLKLRQMAVDNTLQQQGVGKLLVAAAENYGRENGFKKIQLHARKNAIGFYEKLGYSVYGSEFEEVTIPHMAMEKLL